MVLIYFWILPFLKVDHKDKKFFVLVLYVTTLVGGEGMKSYTVLVHHGERITHMDSDSDEVEVHQGFVDDIDGLLNETFRHVLEGDKDGDGPNEDAKKFINCLKKKNKIYILVTLNGWSNAFFTVLLELLKEEIPHLSILGFFNKIKAIVKDLGLGYNKIHACPNDYILFWDTYEDDEFCPVCGASRYIEYIEVDTKVDKLKKNPCLQRF
ncbi:hypothetical protein AHAS_Ahas01G0172100 [Arachis hypogaea]